MLKREICVLAEVNDLIFKCVKHTELGRVYHFSELRMVFGRDEVDHLRQLSDWATRMYLQCHEQSVITYEITSASRLYLLQRNRTRMREEMSLIACKDAIP